VTRRLDLLGKGPPLLLDGATGTELERRGVACELPLWSARALLDAPELVRRIHVDYARAGVDLLTANTFRTQRRALDRAGIGHRAAELTELAVRLAREAAMQNGAPLVLGSAAPLEDCFQPDLVPGPAELAAEHAEHATHLAQAGVDAILVETMNTLREAKAAVVAARATGLPVLASFVCGDAATLLSGEPLLAALDAVAPLGPTALLVNCLPPSRVGACLPVLRDREAAFGVYANLHGEDRLPEDFAALGSQWIESGACIVGGCCGTTPGHLSALAHRVRSG
jgi:S-methylmethionine-dependent homocysteine/selenocysteine methylase